jgi:hypothetical protein
MFQTAFYFIEHEDVVFEVPSDHGGACALQSRLVMEFFIGTAVLRSSDGSVTKLSVTGACRMGRCGWYGLYGGA